MSIQDAVRRTIRRYGLIAPGARVCVALSGGGDSVALLLVLSDLASELGCEIAGAAHLNHLLRGDASDADEAFCRQITARLGLPLEVERVDVGELARRHKISIELAAHDARAAFFESAAERLKATLVAVGHTKNDQAETYLLRLLRGAGPRGLGGIHPRSGSIIRPFLGTSRDEIRQFLQERATAFREDASNAEVSIPRNRVRHELLPFLADRFTPAIVDVLDRDAAIARDDAAFLEAVSEATALRLLEKVPDGLEIPVPALLAEHPAVARRVIRQAQRLVAREKFLGFEAADAVLSLAVSKSAGPLDLPGHRVNLRGEKLVLSARRGRGNSRELESFRNAAFSYELAVPGRVTVPEAACEISAEPQLVGAVDVVTGLVSRADEVAVEAGQLATPLEVRSRRPGDRFRPLGLRGHKKLQDLFVDAKIARDARGSVPIVTDAAGRIVWVAGVSVAEEFRVTDRTRAVVILKRLPS